MRQALISFLFVALLAGCAGAPAPHAPAPLKPIDPANFYTGTWYEIARTPISLTNNCMAGTTIFYRRADGQLMERDACHKGSPVGREKVFLGYVVFDNAEHNKITVHYRIFGFLPVTQHYWMLDHDAAQSWFIVSDPSLTHVDILSRDPRPAPTEISAWETEVAELGYDPGKLEFPRLTPAPR